MAKSRCGGHEQGLEHIREAHAKCVKKLAQDDVIIAEVRAEVLKRAKALYTLIGHLSENSYQVLGIKSISEVYDILDGVDTRYEE